MWRRVALPLGRRQSRCCAASLLAPRPAAAQPQLCAASSTAEPTRGLVPPQYRVTEVRVGALNGRGGAVSQHWKEHTLCGRDVCELAGWRLRDLRFLDPIARSGVLLRAAEATASNASDAQCILTFPNMKMVVTHDRALIFETRIPVVKRVRRLLADYDGRPASEAPPPSSMTVGSAPSPPLVPSPAPFGVAVFENALSMVYRDLRNQVVLLCKMMALVARRLNGLNDTGSATTLSSSLSVLKAGSQLLASLSDNVDSVNALLRSDEDLDQLARALTNDPQASHDELEIILEEHARCVSGAAAQLNLALEALDTSKQFYRIRISDVRNSLLRTSLNISIGAVSIAAGALVAGVFGQNLTSGLEHDPNMFFVATSGIVLGCGSLGGLLLHRVNSVGRLRPTATAKSVDSVVHLGAHLRLAQQLQKLSTDFLTIEHDISEPQILLADCAESVGAGLGEEDGVEMDTLLSHLRQGGVPAKLLLPIADAGEENADLFELLLHDLDRDHDGHITLTEFLVDFERA